MRNGEKLTSDFGKKMRSSVLEEKKITYFCKKQKNPSESDATEKKEVKHLNFQQK